MEKALVVLPWFTASAYQDRWSPEDSMEELGHLAKAARLEVVGQERVNRDRPTPGLFLGKGKVEDLRAKARALKAEVVVFGEDLSFTQQRNLEEGLGQKVVDRTQLILDIFARRARSQEGKTQVELAQLQYLLPRLAGKGIMLSRLGSGIGTRGPGEQKLEMDRRKIRLRVGRLAREIQEIHNRRAIARAKRHEEEIPTAALIGYTNVGKTTLLNALTRAGARALDQPFTTLDPLARRLVLPTCQPVLLSDTVGFLHRLPHHLVEAFRATLEEVTEADVLLHVCDASSVLLEEHSQAVYEVLGLLQAQEKTLLTVMNKADRLDEAARQGLMRRYPEAVFLSALTGEGLSVLTDRLGSILNWLTRPACIRILPGEERWLKRIYDEARVLEREDQPQAIVLKARVPERLFGQLKKAGKIIAE
jgi:GTP-binding protein HflX